jgi:hypothetical protein
LSKLREIEKQNASMSTSYNLQMSIDKQKRDHILRKEEEYIEKTNKLKDLRKKRDITELKNLDD